MTTTITSTGNITSTQSVSINSSNTGPVIIVISGSWSGNINFYGYNGTAWSLANVTTSSNTSTFFTSTNGSFTAPTGYAMFQVMGNVLNSGTANVVMSASTLSPTGGTIAMTGVGTAGVPAPGVMTVQGINSGTAIPVSIAGTLATSGVSTGTTGSTAPTSATLLGGSDGANLRAVSVTAAGLLNVAPLPTGANTIGTVNALGTNTAGAAVTTGLMTVQGSASGVAIPITGSVGLSGVPGVTATQVTAANLNATVVGAGAAGTVNAGVVTVQGIASMTPVQTTVTAALPAGTNTIGNVNINALTTTSNFGYARSILIPGTISTNYVIATAAQAANTPGTTSYNATHTQAIMSPGGGNCSLTLVDGQTVVLPMVAGFVYSVFATQINSASTTTTDLQVFI